MKFLATSLLALNLISNVAMAAPASIKEIKSNIGKGILQFDVEAGYKDRCVELESANIYEESARFTTYYLHLVSSKEELLDKITFSTSAKGSYGMFSAGAKTSFVKEIKWNHNSNYILVRAVRVTKKENISVDNILLSKYARNQLLNSKGQFLQSCGNSFAQTLNIGGEIYGLIEITSNSYSEKQSISMSLNASGAYSGGSASGSAEYTRKIEQLSELYTAKVKIEHTGGEQIKYKETVEGLLELSRRIEEISDSNPVVLTAETRDYSTLSNYPIIVNDGELKIRQDNIDFAEGKLKTARNLSSQILYILQNEKDFRRFDEKSLKNKLAYLEEKILELKKFIVRSYNFLNESDVKTLILDLSVDLPKMKFGAANDGLKIQCQSEENSICGVKSYKDIKSSACNVVGPNEGTGPSCGSEYLERASNVCGIKSFKVAAGAVCGVSRYKQCHHRSCGKNLDGSRKRCRSSSCGAEIYKSCEDKSFGVKEYNSCRDVSHGVEKYYTCKHKDFGFEYESCEHLTHGPGQFNVCDVAKIGAQETFCPEF